MNKRVTSPFLDDKKMYRKVKSFHLNEKVFYSKNGKVSVGKQK